MRSDSELTTEEAAAFLGVSPWRVRQFVIAGRLEARKVGEGRRATYYFTRAELERFKAIPRRRGRPAVRAGER